MLTDKEIEELRDAIKTSRRPLIFFDDDTDGLSSFLLFYHYARNYAEDIKGVIVKSSPILKDDIYIRKIEEYQPDKIFILDKPMVHQDFLDKIKIPVYWLDHHPMQDKLNVHYYNPLRHKAKGFDPDNRPTTYWAYKIVEEPENFLWIAMVGCTGDWFIPEFSKKFSIEYPELLPKDLKVRNPGTVLHETTLGKLCRIIQFNLKGQTKQVMTSIKIFTRISDPYDILEQKTAQGKLIYKQFEKLNKMYEEIKSRVEIGKDRVVVFEYSDDYSLTSDLSNEIQYYNPEKLIVIARLKDDEMKISLRSENLNVRDILKKSLIGVEGYGGGHEHACGSCVKKKDFDKFVDNLRKNSSE
jgi:single-stranded DNA-specific DHH superfamily exonuclease